MGANTDSSPFQSSPFDNPTSPRLFWQNRNTSKQNENDLYGGRAGSPSPTRRSSIERLQKASRVKNSTMYAREQKHEYDPTRVPTIERPLAKVQGNAYSSTGTAGFQAGHGRSESQNSIPTLYSPDRTMTSPKPTFSAPSTPSKSALSASRFKSSYDSPLGDLSFDNFESSFGDHDLPNGKSLHRSMKSVTFDNAPPQVNEYEMITPDISTIGSDSREGSYDTEEEEDGYEHYRQSHDIDLHEDSFDATLEDTDKTPVVGPDDWRQDHGHRLESSPLPEATPVQASAGRPQHMRTDSCTSSGEHRPLPPLPGMGHQRTQSNSSAGLSATAERMLGSPFRGLPSPPPASTSKSEIQNIGNTQMSLEDRLKLMMLSDETSPKASDQTAKSFAEQQRERRMRRAGTRDRVASPTPEHEPADSEAGEGDDTLGDISGLDMDYQLPSISRQSILTRVNGNKAFERESDYNFNSSPAPSSPERPAVYDPDVPIASIEDSVLEENTEQSEASAVFGGGDDKESDVLDLYQRSEDDQSEAGQSSEDDDSDSHYSDEVQKAQLQYAEEDTVTTPRATTPAEEEAIINFSATMPQVNQNNRDSDFTRSLQSFMLPKPKDTEALTHVESLKMAEARDYLQRPQTPEQRMPKPGLYDGSGWGDPEDEDEEEEPGTPESVIHHPVSDDDDEAELEEFDEAEEPVHEMIVEEEEVETPAVPERVATIKASGSKLKTRPSATPSDLAAMREARRQVSREVAPLPDIPPIPERHRNRISRDFDTESPLGGSADDYMDRHPSFKKRSLTLDLDLGLSLDQDFDRVIEAQKVAFRQLSFQKQSLATSDSPTGQVSGRQVVVATDETPGRTPGRTSSRETRLNANITSRKQRGYLMRQNTKLVTASDKQSFEEIKDATRSAGNSPIKQTRPQSWTVEPWNGKARQRSIRKRHGPSMSGPVPPMPGQESNAATLNPLAEEEAQPELATEECGERGRLFVKVMGVKDLDLPIPKSKSPLYPHEICVTKHP